MLVKLKIDEKEKEVEIKKISMKELQCELIPEIENRLKELQNTDQQEISTIKELFKSIDAGKIKSFIMGNIPYVQLKLEKHTNLSMKDIEGLSPAETIDLTKKILSVSFGEDVGKLLNGFKSFFQSLIIPAMKQMI